MSNKRIAELEAVVRAAIVTVEYRCAASQGRGPWATLPDWHVEARRLDDERCRAAWTAKLSPSVPAMSCAKAQPDRNENNDLPTDLQSGA